VCGAGGRECSWEKDRAAEILCGMGALRDHVTRADRLFRVYSISCKGTGRIAKYLENRNVNCQKDVIFYSLSRLYEKKVGSRFGRRFYSPISVISMSTLRSGFNFRIAVRTMNIVYKNLKRK